MFLHGEGESDRDWLIQQEWYGVPFECLLADRMMLPLIVNHANDGIRGTSRKVQASALKCNRISLIAEDQQAPQPRQAPRLEGINCLKLPLEIGLSGNRLVRLLLYAAFSSAGELACNRAEEGIQLIESHHRIAEIAATSEQYAMANPLVAFRRNQGDKSAERIAHCNIVFWRKLPCGRDEIIGALVHPRTEVAEC